MKQTRNILIALCTFALALAPINIATAQVTDLLASISAALESGDSASLESLLQDVEALSLEDQADIAAQLNELAADLAASNPTFAAQLLSTTSTLANNLAASNPVLAGELGTVINQILSDNPALLDVPDVDIPPPPPPPPPPPENPNITDPDVNEDLDPSPVT